MEAATTRGATESGSPRRAALLALAVASVVAVGAAIAILVVGRDDSAPRASDPAECVGLEAARARACYARAFTGMVEGLDDPRPAVEAIADSAWSVGGFLLSNCHGIMHTVGRTYAGERGVTLAKLMDYLPRSNDPGCSAGFAHGLVTGVAPDIDPRRPDQADVVCSEAGTRYQRYSCTHGLGHAFMRLNDDRLPPALAFCRELGPGAASDCAQGAYHDYWFAVVGADDAELPGDAVTDPRKLCGAQPAAFVRPCWYRAFVDNRPDVQVRTPADLDALCSGLDGLQRAACMTAASVIGPPDPAVQLQLCSGLAEPTDAESCVRGTKVQNLFGYPIADYVDLIGGCERFGRTVRSACYRWLGKTLAVLTDGVFGETGCPRLGTLEARRQCRAGARSMDEALITFS